MQNQCSLRLMAHTVIEEVIKQKVNIFVLPKRTLTGGILKSGV